jgi:hypothetical protein
MNVQLSTIRNLRGNASPSKPARVDGPHENVPADRVELSAEALQPQAKSGARGWRRAGTYVALGLALVMSLGAVGCAGHATPAPEPVAVTQKVEVPPSPYRQLGREVREIGLQGKEVGKEVGRAGKELGKEMSSVAKDFWAGVRGQ